MAAAPRATDRSQRSRNSYNSPPSPLGSTNSTSTTPPPDTSSCQVVGRNHCDDRRNAAPSSAPGTEAIPPITTMVNTEKFSPAKYGPSPNACWWSTKMQPA